MTVIAIGGEKGGVGKTCIAVNVAALLAGKGGRVLLLDTDSRPNALSWLGERPDVLPKIHGAWEPQRVPTDLSGWDHVVIDAGAGDTEVLRHAMEIADLLVSPFKPAQFDIWKARAVSKRIAEARTFNRSLDAVAFVNCANPTIGRQDEGVMARAALKLEMSAWRVAEIIVRDLKAFVTTQQYGIGVHEHGRRGAQATEDMWQLMSELRLTGEAM
jgi:chromosome partitioning protein